MKTQVLCRRFDDGKGVAELEEQTHGVRSIASLVVLCLSVNDGHPVIAVQTNEAARSLGIRTGAIKLVFLDAYGSCRQSKPDKIDDSVDRAFAAVRDYILECDAKGREAEGWTAVGHTETERDQLKAILERAAKEGVEELNTLLPAGHKIVRSPLGLIWRDEEDRKVAMWSMLNPSKIELSPYAVRALTQPMTAEEIRTVSFSGTDKPVTAEELAQAMTQPPQSDENRG